MKPRLWIAALLMTALVPFLSGCARVSGGMTGPDVTASPDTAKAAYHALTQEEAKARMDSGDALIILDVRTQQEYSAGHIPGAVLLPNEAIGTEAPPELPNKSAEILVYCRSGNRSAQAVNKLAAMGYTAVYDFGGINTWPYDVVTE